MKITAAPVPFAQTRLPPHPLVRKAYDLVSVAHNRAAIVAIANIMFEKCPDITPDAVAGHMVSFVAQDLKMDADDVARALSPRAAEICTGTQEIQTKMDGLVHLHPDHEVRAGFIAIAIHDLKDDLESYKEFKNDDLIALPTNVPGVNGEVTVRDAIGSAFVFFGKAVLPAVNMCEEWPGLQREFKDVFDRVYDRMQLDDVPVTVTRTSKPPSFN